MFVALDPDGNPVPQTRPPVIRSLRSTSVLLLQYQSAFAALLTGYWLFRGWDTFGVSPAYHAMRQVGTEEAWAWIFLITGILHLLSIGTGRRFYRRLACIMTIALWTFVTVCFYLSVPSSMGVPIYGTMALSSLVSYLAMPSTRHRVRMKGTEG